MNILLKIMRQMDALRKNYTSYFILYMKYIFLTHNIFLVFLNSFLFEKLKKVKTVLATDEVYGSNENEDDLVKAIGEEYNRLMAFNKYTSMKYNLKHNLSRGGELLKNHG